MGSSLFFRRFYNYHSSKYFNNFIQLLKLFSTIFIFYQACHVPVAVGGGCGCCGADYGYGAPYGGTGGLGSLGLGGLFGGRF